MKRERQRSEADLETLYCLLFGRTISLDEVQKMKDVPIDLDAVVEIKSESLLRSLLNFGLIKKREYLMALQRIEAKKEERVLNENLPDQSVTDDNQWMQSESLTEGSLLAQAGEIQMSDSMESIARALELSPSPPSTPTERLNYAFVYEQTAEEYASSSLSMKISPVGQRLNAKVTDSASKGPKLTDEEIRLGLIKQLQSADEGSFHHRALLNRLSHLSNETGNANDRATKENTEQELSATLWKPSTTINQSENPKGRHPLRALRMSQESGMRGMDIMKDDWTFPTNLGRPIKRAAGAVRQPAVAMAAGPSSGQSPVGTSSVRTKAESSSGPVQGTTQRLQPRELQECNPQRRDEGDEAAMPLAEATSSESTRMQRRIIRVVRPLRATTSSSGNSATKRVVQIEANGSIATPVQVAGAVGAPTLRLPVPTPPVGNVVRVQHPQNAANALTRPQRPAILQIQTEIRPPRSDMQR